MNNYETNNKTPPASPGAPEWTGWKTRIFETGEPRAGKRAKTADVRVGSSLIRIRRGLFSVRLKKKKESPANSRTHDYYKYVYYTLYYRQYIIIILVYHVHVYTCDII